VTSVQPAWSEQFDPGALAPVPPLELPSPVTRDWAWGGATGAGVKVAVVDSGIDADHPAVGRVAGAVAVELDREAPDGVRYVEGPHSDEFGHGTACAGLIRRAAPEVDLYSVRVLGPTLRGTGVAFAAGIRWAIENGMQVVNLSLSTRSRDHFAVLHELADQAYFRGVMLVGAVNNVEAPSYPSQYATVFSVAARAGSHGPFSFACNPTPPVEFGAPGIDVDVPWLGGKTMRVTGNSFAAAHISGVIAAVLSKHPALRPFQMKTVLHAVADNAAGAPSSEISGR
jgi:subtilisin family serine protease